MAGIRIIGTGSFPGDKIVTNSDMEKIVDTSDQWIVSKTGIRSRYFADKLTNADMAYEAAVKALDDAENHGRRHFRMYSMHVYPGRSHAGSVLSGGRKAWNTGKRPEL